MFVDSYLQLNALEAGKYEQELAKLTEDEQEVRMEYLTSWEKKGMQKGVESLVTRMLRRRLGELPTTAQAKIDLEPGSDGRSGRGAPQLHQPGRPRPLAQRH